jgi:hypothetical protein
LRRLESAKTSTTAAFKGITPDGAVIPGLFPLQDTGISTTPITSAAQAFLAALSQETRTTATFAVDSDAWHQWCNIHPFVSRHGLLIEEMSNAQRNLALDMVRQSLSPAGYGTALGVMRLNETIREITGKGDEYGEWLYWLSIMGTPIDGEPWGWQLDGHHLNLNAFVLNGQLVMSPAFMGSEPVATDEGRYAGTRVFQAEEQHALDLMRDMTAEQQRKAVIGDELPPEVFTTAFRDNFEMHYEGIKYEELSSAQQGLLLGLAELYVGRMRPDHARIKMDEVREHLSETYFSWTGSFEEKGLFYYRIHSPVVLIEFDHQHGLALEEDSPQRNHIHTILRTPNGNDYGRDLLRQHRERVPHPQG